ncbi:hypothetical protein KJY77_02900 [Canibacter sp. lx-72]|uniref:hypothetical protein n=1 Tax=Canibacter zhuwentaonis TaxID=2837491 RepID=UPI001BDD6FB5|nr:hypothetical protein [Canibacter zhuwentaonis]MBT1018089.1 hypothetical protein [Canibacter zhuwentaonis]MBT1035375.1 hypothetical protein [Canibacter zhuwentaonis]
MKLQHLFLILKPASLLAFLRLVRSAHTDSSRITGTAVYQSPFATLRDATGELRAVENATAEPLSQVRLAVAGDFAFAQSLPVDLHPGERLRLCRHSVSRCQFADTAVLRWFDKQGAERLWAVPVR